MKRITKILSVIFAIILCVGLLTPLNRAQAAAAPKLNKASRTLFVGGSKVAASTYKGTYTLKIKNKTKKYSAQWSSSDTTVAKVTKLKAGRAKVTAVSAGKATITCKFTDKVTGKSYTLTSKFTIRNNASKVAIGKNGLPDTWNVGTKIKLSSLMYDENNKASKRGETVTDYINWVSSDTKVATVTKDGTIEAVGEGTAEITCYTYQASKFKNIKHATAKDSVTINVKPAGLQEVKQKTLNTMELIFDGNMSAVVTKDNIEVSKAITSTFSTNVSVKSLEFDETGKIATVTLVEEFADKTEYTVKYGEISKKFTAIKGEPVAIKIYTANGKNIAVVGEYQQLYFKFFNSQGVDITPINKAAYDELVKYINISGDIGSIDFFLSNTDKTVIFNKEGKEAVIYAEYHSRKYDSAYNELVYKADIVITSISEASTITLTDWLVTNDDTMMGEDFDWEEKSQTIAAGDNGYRLIVQAKNADNEEIYSDDLGSKFTFKCGNTNIMIMDEATYLANLLPFKTGTVDIAVFYDGTSIGKITLPIQANRVAAAIKFDKNNVNVSNKIGYDLCTFVVTVVDQYNETIKLNSAEEITVSCSDPLSPPVIKNLNSDGTLTASFNGYGYGYSTNNFVTYGYNVKYEVGNPVNSTFVATVRMPVGDSTYALDIPKTLDLKLINGAANFPVIPVVVYEYKNGVKYDKIANIKSSKDVSLNFGEYYYQLNPATQDFTQLSNEILPYIINASNDVIKAKTGTFNVAVFKKGVGNNDQFIANGQFTLKDTTAKPVIVIKAEKAATPIAIGNEVSMKQALLECLTIKLGSKTVAIGDIVKLNFTGINSQMHVYSIVIKEKIAIGGHDYYLTHTIDINKSIKN